MSQIFLSILNMSLSASYIVLAVLLLRLILKKAPKWIAVLLWGIVALRLICPFSIESVMSLIPSAEVVSPDIMIDQTPEINTGIPIVNDTLNPIIVESFSPAVGDSANPLQIIIPFLTAVWIVGIAALLVYTAVSYLRLKRKIGTAVLIRDNIYKSENIASPFVLGLIKPKIYLPFNMSEKDASHVIAHENAHIRRKDYLWKPIGFLLLTLHWFNPLMWLGYILLCRDIELACDEKVIGQLDRDARADYTEALLSCSVSRRMIAACPLAFGEVGVKERIRSVLSYKKPAFWIIIIAVVACVAVAVCFLTDPKSDYDNEAFSCTQYAETDGKLSAVRLIDFTQETVDRIISILNDSKWEKGMTNCACDFEFKLRDATVTYHSECGTLVDKDRGYSAILSDELRYELNMLLKGVYVKPDNYKSPISCYQYVEKCGELSSRRNIPLTKEATSLIFDILDECKWNYGIMSCQTGDFVFTYNNTTILYDSKGLLIDHARGREACIDEETQTRLNRLLGTDTPLDRLHKKYPGYIGLDASNGLDVYVWQMSRNNFYFGLLPHSDQPRDRTDDEVMDLRGVDESQMREILASYDIDESQVYIVPWQCPLSSYICEYWRIREGEDIEAKKAEYLDYVRKMIFAPSEIYTKGLSIRYKSPDNNDYLRQEYGGEAFGITVEDGVLYTVNDGVKMRMGMVKKTQINYYNFDKYITMKYDGLDYTERINEMRINNKTAYEFLPDPAFGGCTVYYVMEQKTGETLVVYGEYKNGEKQHDVKYIFSLK
ncbi:MAG: hypothetical protein E7634_05835 [Ruminococcaceae bacterium]|nr:hypothetical protein [Oscillospiraceae bacterium]